MPHDRAGQPRLLVIADGATATLLATERAPAEPTLRAMLHVPLSADTSRANAPMTDLVQFVQDNGLTRRPARVLLLGAGTVVHRLQMPRMKPRQRRRAVRTRLTTYAAGRELFIAERVLAPSAGSATPVLAAGADAALVRTICATLANVGVRVSEVTTLATSAPAPATSGRVVQVLLGERTSAIQIFEDGQLTHCRDVLVGRADFVTAYQRPILTDDGPVTLSPAEADDLCRTVGVPTGDQDQLHQSIRASQLWPLATPVVQRLRDEIAQTIQLDDRDQQGALNLLGAPSLPGLAEVLATELGLDGPVTPDEQVETTFLSGLGYRDRSEASIDLLPPEERMVRRLSMPALAASLSAMLIVFSNAHAPREVHAQMADMRAAASSLNIQQESIQEQLDDAHEREAALLTQLRTNIHLMRALPPSVDTLQVSRTLFDSVPLNVTITQVHINARGKPCTIDITATCDAAHAAGVVAADWARKLSESSLFAEAEVSSVSGGDAEQASLFAIQATLD